MIQNLVRRIDWSAASADETERLLTREWLLTNGLGGYASGTVAGVLTRRYHGLLIAALPAPIGRTVMLNHVSEALTLPEGDAVSIGGEERVGSSLQLHAGYLREFRLEAGLPVWRFVFGAAIVEKRLVLPHGQNTVHVTYQLVEAGGPVHLTLMPAVHFRPHDAPVNRHIDWQYALTAVDNRYEITVRPHTLVLRLRVHGQHPRFTLESRHVSEVLYRVERSRGYDATGDLWCPGSFGVDITTDQPATLVASSEPWNIVDALTPNAALAAERERRRRLLTLAPAPARDGICSELVLAADQFIISPAGRVEDGARAKATGDEVRTVIAGYHWFTDWGRDTMISLDGLTLATGRHTEAGYILRTFAHYVRDGLIPNLFPEGQKEGLYHTADATLWFFQAAHRYLEATGDRDTLRQLLPKFLSIVEHHLKGTRFGIGVDPVDGLLRQGAQGYQLTWMDAKVGDWVVTPRRGKAVEINALWYNALRLLEKWLRAERTERQAAEIAKHADRAYRSFNERFWYEKGGYLCDVVDGETGNDTACRPNQIFALSLPNAVLEKKRWAAVLQVVSDRLLTPVGL